MIGPRERELKRILKGIYNEMQSLLVDINKLDDACANFLLNRIRDYPDPWTRPKIPADDPIFAQEKELVAKRTRYLTLEKDGMVYQEELEQIRIARNKARLQEKQEAAERARREAAAQTEE